MTFIRLNGLYLSPIFRRRKSILLGAIALLTVGCVSDGGRDYPLIPSLNGGNGGSYNAPSRAVPKSSPLSPVHPITPYNPDEPSHVFEEGIIAASWDEAYRVCSRKAQEQGVKLKEVRMPRARHQLSQITEAAR